MAKKMELAKKYKTLLDNHEIDTSKRLQHFFSQIDHESQNFKRLKESLNYSVDGLLKTFGRHRISKIDCKKFGRTKTQPANQEAIANIIYGGEFGKKNLGNDALGDGWKYIGRGFKQVTGKANYTKLSKDTGIDYVNNPEWLEREADAMLSACWFWKSNNCNKFADVDDVRGLTLKINGGTIGLAERTEKLKLYKETFNNSIS